MLKKNHKSSENHNHLIKTEDVKLLDKLEKKDFTTRTKTLAKKLAEQRGQDNFLGVVKNVDGVHSKNHDEFLRYWYEFYELLYKNDPNFDATNLEGDPGDPILEPLVSENQHILNDPISYDEFMSTLTSLTKNKAPGEDGLILEEILSLDNAGLKTLHKLVKIFWILEKVPGEMKICVLVPLLKKGDIHDPANYRPIALMSTLLKLYQYILNSRLVNFLEVTGFFHDEQSGFRKGRSIMDCHLLLSEVLNSRQGATGARGGTYTEPLLTAFLDLRKAFDRVPRELLWQKLRAAGVGEHFLNIIIDQFTNIKGKVRLGGALTDAFEISSGVVQGSRLGPILFDVFLNDLLGEIKLQCSGITFAGGINLQTLAFADDLCLLAATPAELDKMLKICGKWAERNFMQFNSKKSFITVFNKFGIAAKKRKDLLFELGGGPVEIVGRVTYLGILLRGAAKPYRFPI